MKSHTLLAGAFLGISAFAKTAFAAEFPKSFKWCIATSAHQIEGNNANSDWWDWEQVPGHIKRGEKSGLACNHWDQLEEDVGLLQELHAREYRFSIEWAKIEPQPGRWDLEAVAHYQREIELLRLAGIEPMVTLQHFSLPRWFRAKGAWEWEGAPDAFARYAAFALTAIGPGVRDWITINEPLVHLLFGYVVGAQPPGKHGDFNTLKKPVVGLLKAHAAAYRAMKKAATAQIRVGLAHHMRIFDPAKSWSPLDGFLAGKLDQAWNWAFSEALETGRLRYDIPFVTDVDEAIENIANTQDFIGLNYYTRDMVSLVFHAPGFEFSVPDGAEKSDLGWEIYPEGLYRMLKSVARRFPGKSIFITENGLADSADAKRTIFMESHLKAAERAIREGVPVEGYCYWSLMDNFEWGEGFAPRFGLFETDYATFARRPRPSAARFSEIALRNGL